MRPFLAPINSQAAAFWCCRLDYDDNQKARKDSLISYGRLDYCSATKILLAFISRAAGSTDTTSRKSAIEEKMFWKVTLSSALKLFLQKIFARLTSLLFTLISIWNHARSVSFKTVGRVIDRDIILFLGCMVKFQARKANSWGRSASLNPGNRVCVLFFFSVFSFSLPSYF